MVQCDVVFLRGGGKDAGGCAATFSSMMRGGASFLLGVSAVLVPRCCQDADVLVIALVVYGRVWYSGGPTQNVL